MATGSQRLARTKPSCAPRYHDPAKAAASGRATSAGSSPAISAMIRPKPPTQARVSPSPAGCSRLSSRKLASAVAAISTPLIRAPLGPVKTVMKPSSLALISSDWPTNTTLPARARSAADSFGSSTWCMGTVRTRPAGP